MRPIVIDGLVWSVSLSVTIVSLAKTAEPIEILFRKWIRMRPKNSVLDPQIPMEMGNFEGKGAAHCKV